MTLGKDIRWWTRQRGGGSKPSGGKCAISTLRSASRARPSRPDPLRRCRGNTTGDFARRSSRVQSCSCRQLLESRPLFLVERLSPTSTFRLLNIELSVSSDHSSEQIRTLRADVAFHRSSAGINHLREALTWREQIYLRPSHYFEGMVDVGAQSPADRGAPLPMSDSSVGVGRSSHRAHGIGARREA